MEDLHNRISINQKVCNGKPKIRNMRITVVQLIDLLAAGMTNDEILKDYPYLELADIQA